MTPPNRRENARREAALGDDALRAAEALLGLALPNDAVSRAYYAAFHYARALLLGDGLEPRTHRGVFSLLEERFEKTGRLSPAAVSSFARLQTFRGFADYDASERLTAERAAEEVAAARSFVEEARAVLEAVGAGEG
jgi:hypothetical protein